LDAASLATPIEKLLAQFDPDLPVSNVLTMEQSIGKSTPDVSFTSILVLAFAVIALFLAAVGLYGVVSYLGTQRTGEIGIRIALGAPRNFVLRLMLLDGLWPAAVGVGHWNVSGRAPSAVDPHHALWHKPSGLDSVCAGHSGVVAGRRVRLRPPGLARIAPRPDAGIANGIAVARPRIG
jgi:hypothetical protein